MNTSDAMMIRFWGVRGSYPTPGSDTVRYGGNTACVEIEVGGSTIILDAGTGIIPLGQSLVRRARQAGRSVAALLLLSHLHHDHTQGFPFFMPAFIPNSNLHIYGPDFLTAGPEAALKQVMLPPYFPVRLVDLSANLSFYALRDTDTLYVGESAETPQVVSVSSQANSLENGIRKDCERKDCIRICVMRSYAHPNGVFHYRLDWRGRSVVYATDTEGYVSGDRRLANFARGADVLIHDAQYTDEHYLGLVPGLSVTQGFGHSTVSMACQAAASAEAKRLILFHHAPEYSDDQMDRLQARAREVFPRVDVAYEGMEIQLSGAEMLEPVETTSLSR